jgi:thiol-disulfide isomerase/thioredoxin
MLKLRLIILAIMGLSFITLNSCSKEQAESKLDNQNAKDIQKIPAKVFPLVSSEKPVGKKAGDFIWEQNGKQVRFSEFTKDKYVLLNFWGTWCPPCRRELPDLVAIAKEMESKGLVVIGAALERAQTMNEALDIVSSFWESKQLFYPVIISTPELANAYGGINAVPTTFLINNKGEIVNSFEGGRSKEEFMIEINKMMKE